MLEFTEHTVEEYKALVHFCSEHRLQPEKTLADFVGSKEDYLKTEEEEGELHDLPGYIGSAIELSIDRFLMGRKEEEERRRLEENLSEFIANFKCPSCNSSIERFEIYLNQLVCKNCHASYEIPCPKCKTGLRVNETGAYVTEYRCPSCKFTMKTAQ